MHSAEKVEDVVMEDVIRKKKRLAGRKRAAAVLLGLTLLLDTALGGTVRAENGGKTSQDAELETQRTSSKVDYEGQKAGGKDN